MKSIFCKNPFSLFQASRVVPHDGHDAMPRLEPLGPTWPPRVHCWKCPRPRPQEWWYEIGQSVRWSDALRSGTFGDDGWDDGMMGAFIWGKDMNLQLLKGGWIFRILGKTFKKLGGRTWIWEKHEQYPWKSWTFFSQHFRKAHDWLRPEAINVLLRVIGRTNLPTRSSKKTHH